MIGRRVLVLCATVPWRRAACEAMLGSLAAQTHPPAQVILHLDGFARATRRPQAPPGVDVRFRRFLRHRGVGNWWRALDASHVGMLVACVGDDFLYPPGYLERLVALQARHGGAIGWHGWDVVGRNCRFRAQIAAPTPLIRCGTALMIAEAADLLGDAEHELAGVFFAPRGHDEALASCWLWQHDVAMTRPAGRPGVTHLPEGDDPRATSIRDHDRKVSLRRVLRERYGWPDRAQRTNPRVDALVGRDVRAALAQRSAPARQPV